MDSKLSMREFLVACGVVSLVGAVVFAAGYQAASSKYEVQMEAVRQAAERKIEAQRAVTAVLEEQFDEQKKAAEAVAVGNAALVDRLRQQLRSRSCPRSTGAVDASSSADKLADRASDVADFAARCARSADEMSAQIRALQAWIRALK